MRNSISTNLIAACACLLMLALVNTGHADLFSSEPFSAAAYVDGVELPALNPIIPGYTDAWTDVDFGDAEPAVMAGSLAYGGAGYASSTGNKVGKVADTAGIGGGNSGRTFRLLASSLAATNSTTGMRYLSWLFQTGNENAADQPDVYQTLALYNTNTGDGNRFFDAGISSADFGSNNYSYRVQNTTVGNLGIAPDTNVHLYVAKFDLSSTVASDMVTVWLDPALGGVGDPAGGVSLSGLDLQFDRLAFSDYASNSVAWDEIRWGDTFASVTSESFLGCDVNSDNLCNSVDFGIIRDNMFTNGTLADGDLNGDGTIDLSDYRLFKDDPNRVVGGALSAVTAGGVSVPEPTSFVCLAMASLLVCAGRYSSSCCVLKRSTISVSSIG